MSAGDRGKKTILATSSIFLLFALTQDFWSWGGSVPRGPFGVPRWVYVFALLQFGLAVVLFWFGKDLRGASRDGAESEKDE